MDRFLFFFSFENFQRNNNRTVFPVSHGERRRVKLDENGPRGGVNKLGPQTNIAFEKIQNLNT